MADWTELTREMERLLHLRTYPVAYKRLEKVEELEKIPKVRRFDRHFTFCQIPTLVRTGGWTIAVTRDNLGERIAPFTRDQSTVDAKATAYVCVNHSCKLPTTDIDTMLSSLNSR